MFQLFNFIADTDCKKVRILINILPDLGLYCFTTLPNLSSWDVDTICKAWFYILYLSFLNWYNSELDIEVCMFSKYMLPNDQSVAVKQSTCCKRGAEQNIFPYSLSHQPSLPNPTTEQGCHLQLTYSPMTSFFTHWLTLLSAQVLLRFTLHPRHSSTKFLLKTKCRIQETMFAGKFINRSVLMRNWKCRQLMNEMPLLQNALF